MIANRLFLCMIVGFFSYVTLSYSMMNNEPSVWGDLHKNSLSSSSPFHEKDSFFHNNRNEKPEHPATSFHTLRVTQPLKDQITSSILRGSHLSPLLSFCSNFPKTFFEKADVVFRLWPALKYKKRKTLSSVQAAKLNPYTTYMLTVLD